MSRHRGAMNPSTSTPPLALISQTQVCKAMLPEAWATSPSTLTVPIDPALNGFPTNGPNDCVPNGFHPIPYTMVRSPAIPQPMPVPSVVGHPVMPSSFPWLVSNPGSSVPRPPGGSVTMERLAEMVLSLEARLTSQEHHLNLTGMGQPTQGLVFRERDVEAEQLPSGSKATTRPDNQMAIQPESNWGPLAGMLTCNSDQDTAWIPTPQIDGEPNGGVHATQEIPVARKPKVKSQ